MGLANGVQVSTGGANLFVQFNGERATPDQEANYHILDTDYSTYSLIYNCDEYLGGYFSFQQFYILGREIKLS